MKDNLEDFIEVHRQEFDDLEPRKDTWTRIQKELNHEMPQKDYTWIWKAAAVVFLCLSVGLAIERTTGLEVQQVAEASGLSMAKSPSAELTEVENYYTQLIAQKRGEIKSVIDKKGFVDIELLEDIEQLDEMYANLKNDLKRNQNDERLINAMIQNLQLRVEILNKQLRILERISKQEENEKISV
ncbi:MAG: hypothetical protein ABJF04_06620 [Reichenbachiella sp.]|uniref:hypothetical protein n=1 Tax=Reichenbachiella sp. TaxID=2184521 RepID=UPI003263F40A